MNPYAGLTDSEVSCLFAYHAKCVTDYYDMNQESRVERFRKLRLLGDEMESRSSKRHEEFVAKGGLS